MPNLDNIRKWVDALRSGDYEQGAHSLRRFGSFCCLGVACDISGLGVWDEAVTETGTRQFSVGHRRSMSYLPPAVQEWLGLPEPNPRLLGSDSVAVLNDDFKFSFNQIADAIEATYLAGDPR